jgi:hypothetical protein
MLFKKNDIEEKYTVTLCSYKDEGHILWTPKAIIRRKEGEKWEDFPMQWSDEIFFSRKKADDYALIKTKQWLSGNSGIKEKRIFTKEEWASHKLAVFIGLLFLIPIILVVVLSLIFA